MNELYHYGILGQKWGVRRFQNSDGSLTSEGRKRYRKELRADKREAFNLGQEATTLGRAAKYSMDRVAKYQDRVTRRLEKDPNAQKRGTQRAYKKALAAEKAALDIAKEYRRTVQDAEKHCQSLMKKYGKENVKDISYKDVKLSKSAASKYGKDSIRVVNEKVNNLSSWASTGAASVLMTGMMQMASVPLAVIYTPKNANQRGYELANRYYMHEYAKGY